jgi:dynein heavy chain
VHLQVNVYIKLFDPQGLEDQLLGELLLRDRPELEAARDRLVATIASDKRQLQVDFPSLCLPQPFAVHRLLMPAVHVDLHIETHPSYGMDPTPPLTKQELEDKVLRLLRDASGHLLDDDTLIATLNNARTTSGERGALKLYPPDLLGCRTAFGCARSIHHPPNPNSNPNQIQPHPPPPSPPHAPAVIATRVREAESTEAVINSAREGYRLPPARAACLWFVVCDLAGLSPMYQTSLAAFKAMFVHCIGAAPKTAAGAAAAVGGGGGAADGGGGNLEARLAGLRDFLTAHIFSRVR